MSDIPRSVKTKTGKTVRIISPQSADSDFEEGAPVRIHEVPRARLTSPPPVSTSSEGSENGTAEDPFNAASDGEDAKVEGEGICQNTMLSAGDSAKPKDSVLPANPFRKTVATLKVAGKDGETESTAESPKSIKPQYNVDDFKKLLLTGEKMSTAAPPPVTFQTFANIDGSSSNTDVSSVSRHSPLEPAPGAIHDSPRTSQETTLSEDERQRLVGTSPPRPEKLKPSTPRHRHGKLVKANAPQTVSFEDPTLFFAAPETTGYPEPRRSGLTSPNAPGDERKLLPALPPSSGSNTAMEQRNISTSTSSSDTISAESHAGSLLQKKNPPAPPPSRRHGQLRLKSFVSDSGRSSPISEEVLDNTAPQAQSPPSSGTKPVPPPPRRSGSIRQDSSSSNPTTSSIATSSDQSLSSAKASSPTPPTRSPSVAATKRPTRASPIAGSPSMPPPPPPRRRGSSQGSYTPSRHSEDYHHNAAGQRLRSDSGASSISQLQMTPVESNAERKDILADLSALKREVDELRGKFGQ